MLRVLLALLTVFAGAEEAPRVDHQLMPKKQLEIALVEGHSSVKEPEAKSKPEPKVKLLDPRGFWPDGKLGKHIDDLERSERPNLYLAMIGYKGCMYCKTMTPVVLKLRDKGYPISYWDVERHPELHKMFGVKYGYPHFAMVVNGRLWQQCDGTISTNQIVSWFEYAKEVAEGKSTYRQGQPETSYASPGQFNRLIPPKPDHREN